MKPLQKQWQLYYLGFLPGPEELDGIWGSRSEGATREFQRYYSLDPVDGIFGKHTRNKSRSAIEAIQKLLGITVDGLAGPETVEATKAYQQKNGLPVTGQADEATRQRMALDVPQQPQEPAGELWWEEIRYFTREELKCKCGGRYCNGFPAEPQELAVRIADKVREHFGVPAHNISFLRCPQWNALQGGVANSQHMYGEAMDIRVEGVHANKVYSYLKTLPEVRYTYKINSTNVHFDIQKGAR